MSRPCKRLGFASLWVLWGLCVATGFGLMLRYEFASGREPTMKATVPEMLRGLLDEELPTLFLFVHPQCPCTRATIAELARLMADCDGRLVARALFLRPSGTSTDWVQTVLWRRAAAIPGVVAMEDDEGLHAMAAGANTSGQVLVCSSEGELLFAGGITSSRGHEGSSIGIESITNLIHDLGRSRARTPVFGCPLGSGE